ncbi:MAG: DEAD/DEAH box helicase [Chloroflexi bacterium]|nr:DEAD/DEAH box helicase [Chloroflexota bacterium]
MTSVVALDIETTGLDPKKDAILEIGAVRFSGHRVEAEWSTLLHPGRPIPPFITNLTGITDQMVLQAPPIKAVLPALVEFVGDSPIVGHNIAFDLSFLQRNNILKTNDVLDTYEMASVLLPGSSRYNLRALGQSLSVLLPATHRALDDAHATRGVFLRLLEEAHNLPLHILAEIVRLGDGLDWGANWPFRQSLRARTREVSSLRQLDHAYLGPIFSEKLSSGAEPLQALDNPKPLDEDEAAALLELGGVFSHYFPQYEHRPQQVAMLRAVCQAISEGRHLMVEAATGTGKSMAYLVPAALWAMQNKTRVLISTNTINLQDQLINKDIPDLSQALGIDLRAAVLKGRANYLCPRRLENMRRRGPETADEMRVFAKLLVWLQGTSSGDRAEINLNGPAEREVWSRLSAEDEGCSTENCKQVRGGACPFYRARQAAEAAHLLIVNHALLLSDIALGGRVLPEYRALIVDEAHHMEDATTNALSYRITQWEIDRLLRELGGPRSGALGRLLVAANEALSPDSYAQLERLAQQAADLAFRFDHLAKALFTAINQFLFMQREGRPVGAYSHQERIQPATRTSPAWGEVELAWDEAEHTLVPLVELQAVLQKSFPQLLKLFSPEDAELITQFGTIFRRFDELKNNLHELVFEPSEDRIYWVETNPNNNNPALNAAPLHIGQLMREHLWHKKDSIILTSATLTAAGEFDYLRGRLGAEDADELALGSPFDYESAALLYLVNDIPEPSDRQGHQRGVESALINLCRATHGRTLALFTSYDQLKRTSQAIAPALAKNEIIVYEQGEGASPHSLLETFRNSERAVLLGTRAFWEGVDIPGDALSVLVIAKLPFDVPSDPIVAARSETFEDPFYQYQLPEAILRFRQGFGRLIRTQSDRGVVTVLDKRLLTKQYGRLFLESLPTCTSRVGPAANLPRLAAQWLNL